MTGQRPAPINLDEVVSLNTMPTFNGVGIKRMVIKLADGRKQYLEFVPLTAAEKDEREKRLQNLRLLKVAERLAGRQMPGRDKSQTPRERYSPAPIVRRPGVVYFAGCKDMVKIGYTTDIKKRLSSLQTGAPFAITLLATVPAASPQDEKELHRKFKKYRIAGGGAEWFRLTQEIADYIAAIGATPPPILGSGSDEPS